MDQQDSVSSMLFEHRFWLQILGDHARFIAMSMAPEEAAEIQRAQAFITIFDHLLDAARRFTPGSDLTQFNRQVYPRVAELRNFKLHLLRRHLTGRVGTGLSASFFNHMVNELDEFARILIAAINGNPLQAQGAIHHHLLWLDDAVGHAGSISGALDLVEKRLIEKSQRFEKHFLDFYYQAVQLAGFLRTQLRSFPALARFNTQVDLEMRLFQDFLEELKEMGLKAEELGHLTPLMADHMFREECYYLTKLSQASDVPQQQCDPAHSRVEQ
jgi:hypothetical protein